MYYSTIVSSIETHRILLYAAAFEDAAGRVLADAFSTNVVVVGPSSLTLGLRWVWYWRWAWYAENTLPRFRLFANRALTSNVRSRASVGECQHPPPHRRRQCSSVFTYTLNVRAHAHAHVCIARPRAFIACAWFSVWLHWLCVRECGCTPFGGFVGQRLCESVSLCAILTATN